MSALLEAPWQTPNVAEDLRSKIAAEFQLLPETAALLIQRGLKDSERIQAFLYPQFSSLINPERMHRMDEATERLYRAITNKERVLIHGDYDIDGITSTAVLYSFLKAVGIIPHTYIPNRLEESHGISERAIEMAKASNVKLFLTCDCGISSKAQASKLKSLGIDTIITDHHLVPEDGAPEDAIVVNPSQDECDFGDSGMAGVGIAYYLLIALRKKLRDRKFFVNGIAEPNLKSYLDLVTLGTIGDQAPLVGQNRIFVRAGLKELDTTSRQGLRVLLNLCVPADRTVGVHDVAFHVAPKINAAGRLGKAEDAFKLLIEDDPVQSAVLARKLVNYNDERRNLLEAITYEAMREANVQLSDKQNKPRVLVLAKEQWHIGVIGIAAQRLLESTGLPTILLARQGDLLKGSGRSVKNLHLVELLNGCRDLLEHYGGHSVAAGVALKPERLTAFRQKINEQAHLLGGAENGNQLVVDGSIQLERINDRLLKEFALLQPFGEANPEPRFVCTNLAPKEVRTMGNRKEHLRLNLEDSQGVSLPAVAFGLGQYERQKDKSWNVLATPEYNVWQGRRTIRLRLHAIQTA